MAIYYNCLFISSTTCCLLNRHDTVQNKIRTKISHNHWIDNNDLN